MQEQPTLRSLMQLPLAPAKLAESVLVMIDCQNTYRSGVMQLEGVEAALVQCEKLLKRARSAGISIVHIQHDAGEGSPYDVKAAIGRISDIVAPQGSEVVITKQYPSSFEKTDLDAALKKVGAKHLVLAGFMTHMCINSTARAAFNHGYSPTVVANATATRNLPNPLGGEVLAIDVHRGALAAIADLFAIVLPDDSTLV